MKSVVLSLVVLLSGPSLLAQGQAVKTESAVVNQLPDQSGLVGESAYYRNGKRLQVVAEITGARFGAASSGLTVSSFLDANKLLSLSIYSLSGSKLNEEKNDYSTSGQIGTAGAVNLKSFHSNSFYSSLGFYYRDMTYLSSRTVSWAYAGSDWTKSYTGKVTRIEDLGLTLAIGNQWQWEQFTVGCDWIGFSRSISSDLTGDVPENSLELGVSALNFYLGTTF